MRITEHIDQLQSAIEELKNEQTDPILGFVPTMGALHEGHLSLIETAKQNSTIVVCSIFVNPTQFNDSKDLERYPRTIDEDIVKLKSAGCDIVFIPAVQDVYPDGVQAYSINFNGLDEVMEGAFRPGHFEGVAMVVERFFDLVKPDKAFFGLKDFQQVAIIKLMVRTRGLDIEIIPVPIKRSEKGLALSSRNMLLTDIQKEQALVIYQALLEMKKNIAEGMHITAAKNLATAKIEESALKLEYLEVVKNDDLTIAEDLFHPVTCCIAAYCGDVRLIDNMQLN